MLEVHTHSRLCEWDPLTLQTHVCKRLGTRCEENPLPAKHQGPLCLKFHPKSGWREHIGLFSPDTLHGTLSSLLLKHPKDEGPQTWLACLVPPLPEASGGPLLPAPARTKPDDELL